MKKGVDFSDLPENYQDKWVALSADEKEVIAHGDSLAETIKESEKKGEKKPVMLKMPSKSGSYVL